MSGSQQLLLAAVQQAVATDPNFEYTTLLLPGNGTNGAQNNTFLDSSTNAFSITRNGNTTQGTFSPFSQTGWGNYFDGSGDYLETPSNAAFTLGSSGDFTVECWVYATATPGNYAAFMTTWSDANTGYSNRWFIGVHDSKIKWYNDAGGNAIADSSNIQLNTWLHVAVARSGSTITLYINGTAIGTQTTSQSYTTQGTVKLGYSGTGGNYFSGYISNARVVKGTAVYTANFTPPTAPLTAITNTSLLTCQSNRFVDNSTNAFAITRNGDVSVQAFSPFNPTAAWDAATYGGSGYFDGSGDNLTASADITPRGTEDFTIELWYYPTTLAAADRYFILGGSSGSLIFGIANSGNDLCLIQDIVGTVVANFGSRTQLTANAWNYVAVTRDGNTFRCYINGSPTTTASVTSSYSFSVPSGTTMFSSAFAGYASQFRVSRGTARYTGATMTVPTAPTTSDVNTNVLLNFTNAGIYDATSKNDLETVGNAQISTTQSKFGGSSMAFDGTGDELRAYQGPNFDFGTGDFTVEFWAYHSSINFQISVTTGYPTDERGFLIGYYLGAVYCLISTNNSTWNVTLNGGTLNQNTWYHVALVRNGTSFKTYLDGVNQASATNSGPVNNPNNLLSVGGRNANYMNGYLQDLRITKGVARYTSNFTPPTAAFPVL
jgi:hypothetical protein